MLNFKTSRAVKNLGRKVSFLQPLFESIANSFEANATNIIINIDESVTLGGLTPLVNGFTVTDNGDGFTKENIDSFCTLWCDHKHDLGCKGCGRFTWLSVFQRIDIESFVKSEKVRVNIPFSLDFSGEDEVKKETDDSITESKTIISFKYPTLAFHNSGGNRPVDKRPYSNALDLKKKIVEYLGVSLIDYAEDIPQFSITIRTSSGSEQITAKDVDLFESKEFVITVPSGPKSFTIKYQIKSDGNGRRSVFLCSGRRSSHKVLPSKVGLCDSLPNGDSCLFYIIASYLDELETDDRKGLDEYAYQNYENEEADIPYSDLLNYIRTKIAQIVRERYPEQQRQNQRVAKELIAEKPYLSSFVSIENTAVASRKDLEKEASAALDKKREVVSETFVTALKEKDIDPESFKQAVEEVTEVAAIELCQYIVYRQKIVEALTPERLAANDEAYLHNIFMPKRTLTTSNKQYLNTNMWIIDDRFMGYLFASSDNEIFKSNLQTEGESFRQPHDRRRPDLYLLYDRPESDEGINALLVEFKKSSALLSEKKSALTEITDNIGTLRRTKPAVGTIWAFIITKIDDDFRLSILDAGGYDEIKGDSGIEFYKYVRANNAHVYIIDIDRIVRNARIRNQVFVNILN